MKVYATDHRSSAKWLLSYTVSLGLIFGHGGSLSRERIISTGTLTDCSLNIEEVGIWLVAFLSLFFSFPHNMSTSENGSRRGYLPAGGDVISTVFFLLPHFLVTKHFFSCFFMLLFSIDLSGRSLSFFSSPFGPGPNTARRTREDGAQEVRINKQICGWTAFGLKSSCVFH